MTGTRTFDCPWCGAISPVPGSHLGEHFACPECKKGTKLTEKNTSTRPPTAAPPDAPHLSGDRTFDCPWCGAIASVPSSHLGESFRCPECAKGTKLTSTNTRRAMVTAPPPDAPHVENAPAGGARAVALVALLAIGGGAAWYFLAGPGASSPATGKEAAKADPSSAAPSTARAEPAAMEASGAVPTKQVGEPPSMDTGAPPPAMADVPTGTAPEVPSVPDAELKKKAAELAVLTAEQSLAVASKALEDWGQAHPGALEAGDAAVALGEASAEIDRRLADRALVPDLAKATPDQIRAADAAVRAFLDASPARKAAASSVLDAMRSDHGGREVAGVADWHELNVTGDGFRRAAAALAGGFGTLASTVPVELVKATAEAAERLRAAKAQLAAAGGEASPVPSK